MTSRRKLLLLFVTATALASALLLPMRMVLPMAGDQVRALSAREISGPFWNAHARAVSWRGRPVGDLTLRLLPWPLLRGDFGLRIAGRDFTADIVRGDEPGVTRADGLLYLVPRGFPSAELTLELTRVRMRFADRQCRDAGGSIDALLAPAAIAGTDWAPMRLQATPECDGPAWLAVFRPVDSSSTASLRIETRLRIEAGGNYRVETVAAASDPSTRLALQAAGFREGTGAGGLVRVDEGSLVR